MKKKTSKIIAGAGLSAVAAGAVVTGSMVDSDIDVAQPETDEPGSEPLAEAETPLAAPEDDAQPSDEQVAEAITAAELPDDELMASAELPEVEVVAEELHDVETFDELPVASIVEEYAEAEVETPEDDFIDDVLVETEDQFLADNEAEEAPEVEIEAGVDDDMDAALADEVLMAQQMVDADNEEVDDFDADYVDEDDFTSLSDDDIAMKDMGARRMDDTSDKNFIEEIIDDAQEILQDIHNLF